MSGTEIRKMTELRKICETIGLCRIRLKFRTPMKVLVRPSQLVKLW